MNPNPSLITNPMWRLWEERPNPDWKLSGFYADKPGYHNTVEANLKKWPDNYSVKLPLDLVSINRDKARAIDLTMSDIEMVKWTTRMRDSALNPLDNRLSAIKEFYGTLDNKIVYGLSKNNSTGPWRRVTADSTHLWHGHSSIFTVCVNDWQVLSPILSVWEGETFEEWSLRNMEIKLPEQGDTGQAVLFLQYLHNRVRETVVPPSPLIKRDGEYGSATAAAIADFWKKSGGAGSFNGSFMTGWLALQYHEALIAVLTPKPPVVSPKELEEIVNKWLTQNINGGLKASGIFDGRIELP